MTAIFLRETPFAVEVGPYAGVYLSQKAYEARVKQARTEIPLPKSIFELDPWLDEGGGG